MGLFEKLQNLGTAPAAPAAINPPEASPPVAQAPAALVPSAPADPPKEKKPRKVKEAAPVISSSGMEAPRKGSLLVLMDCLLAKDVKANGRRTMQLVDLIAPILKSIADKHGKAHWRFVEYGQGAGILASELDKILADMRTEIDLHGLALVVDGSTAEAQAVKEVLSFHADVLVRGL